MQHEALCGKLEMLAVAVVPLVQFQARLRSSLRLGTVMDLQRLLHTSSERRTLLPVGHTGERLAFIGQIF
jgi:hypothetical protein